ncbi:MAG: Gfo/Idh/MocA family oxidoreductase [Planctomycetota bacterium]|nr:Gfo/Idh/MocA family oxidoreductase [Planctomycetota bacterium]
MRIGLLGHSYHWGYHKHAAEIPGARIVAVACGSPRESLSRFAETSTVPADAVRYDDARKMLDEAQLDLVQVYTDFTEMGGWIREAAQRGIATIAEKPLAFDLEELARTWDVVASTGTPFMAMQGTRGRAAFEAAREAVRDGKVGTPYNSYHQKSYRWNARPETWNDRKTFPGFIPWVGIHAFAWMHWVLGEVFTEVAGWDGYEAHPEVPGCATQAGVVFRQTHGGVALVSMDYLRPKAAPTHGDERMRVAGSTGVVEVFAVEDRCVLIESERGPREIRPSAPVQDPYVRFALSVRGEAEAPVRPWECFRVTELALKAQQAADTGKSVPLTPTAYRD